MVSQVRVQKLIFRTNASRHCFTKWWAWISAVLLLISAGAAYRIFASRLQHILRTPVELPISLSDFPIRIGNWVGADLPIRTTAKEYMEAHFADDFLSRRYINAPTETWADVYIVYCSSRPGGILGHRPRVCYSGAGWVHDSTEQSQFISRVGRKIPCLIHRFHKPGLEYRETVIVNFYIVNGRITTYEDDFSSLFGRRPNIEGDPARYVAQVQISSVVENSVRRAAKDVTDLILEFLPDKNGKVRANEYDNAMSGVLK